MMNNKGQSTIIFVILIPIFIIFAVLIADTAINIYNDKKLKNITEEVLTDILENNVSEEKIESRARIIYEENDIDTEYLNIEISSDKKIKIYNSTLYYSVINSIFKNGTRQSVVRAVGYLDSNNNVIVEFIKDDLDED